MPSSSRPADQRCANLRRGRLIQDTVDRPLRSSQEAGLTVASGPGYGAPGEGSGRWVQQTEPTAQVPSGKRVVTPDRVTSTSPRFGRPERRAPDPRMRAAAAQVRIERSSDFSFGSARDLAEQLYRVMMIPLMQYPHWAPAR